MSVVTCNGRGVVEGRVSFPLLGAWVADLVVQGTDDVTSPVVLQVGATTLRGTVVTSGRDQGNRVSVTIVGGSGGLQTAAPPLDYGQPTTVGAVLRDALAVGRETLSTTTDPSVRSAALSRWTRVRGTVVEAVRAALAPLGASWRVLPDGTIWAGTETWLPLEVDHQVTEELPASSTFRIAVEGATVLPGVTFRGQRITSVVYHLDDTAIRSDLVYGEQETEAALLDALIARRTAHLLYHGTYAMRVVAQNGDETLEVQSPAPDVIPGMSRVQLRLMPGVTSLKVTPGTTVLVGFEGGSPAGAFAGLASPTPNMGLTITSTGVVDVVGTTVKCGGSQPLVLHAALAAWVSALTTAGAPIGLTVPALIAANTTITQGQ